MPVRTTTNAPLPPFTVVIAVGSSLTFWNVRKEAKEAITTSLSSTDGSTPSSKLVVTDVAWNHNHRALAASCCYLPDSKLSNNDSDFVAFVSTKDGAILGSIQSHDKIRQCQSAQFGRTSQYLCLACDNDNLPVVSVWNLQKNIELRRFELHTQGDNRTIKACFDASCRFVFSLALYHFRLYDLKQATETGTFRISQDSRHHHQESREFTCMDHMTDNQGCAWIALGSSDGTVRILDTTDCLSSQDRQDPQQKDRNIRIWKEWNVPVERTVRRKTDGQHGYPLPSNSTGCLELRFLTTTGTKEKLLAVLTPQGVAIYDWSSGELHRLLEWPSSCCRNGVATSMSFCQDARFFAVGFDTGMVHLFDCGGGKIANTLLQPMATFPVPSSKPIRRLLMKIDPEFPGSDNDGGGVGGASSSDRTTSHPHQQRCTTDSQGPEAGKTRYPEPATQQNSLPFASRPVFDSQHVQQASSFTGDRDDDKAGQTRFQMTSTNDGEAIASTRGSTVDGTNHPSTAFRESLDEIVDSLRQEMRTSFLNLHLDMLRQFQIQSDDLQGALRQQAVVLDRLALENRNLRVENQRLVSRLLKEEDHTETEDVTMFQ